MKTLFSRTLAALVFAGLAAAISAAFAVDANAETPQHIELSVSETFDTNSPSASGVFTYALVGDGGEPMPAGSPADEYTFTMDGTSDITLPEIVFNTVGIYEYKLSCVKQDDTYYVYDPQVYTIDIYVTNDTSTPTVLVYLNDGSSVGDKAPQMLFTQAYRGPVATPSPSQSPNPTPTPTPSGASVQTGGVLASQTLWVLMPISGVMAVSGIWLLIIVTRRRKAEENGESTKSL